MEEKQKKKAEKKKEKKSKGKKGEGKDEKRVRVLQVTVNADGWRRERVLV